MTPPMPPQADQTLLKALAVWGPGRGGELGFWARFEPAWRRRLGEALESEPPEAQQQAHSALAALHGWQARPDERQVHPSWWVRAVQDESPAVRATVAREASEVVSASLAGLGPLPSACVHATSRGRGVDALALAASGSWAMRP